MQPIRSILVLLFLQFVVSTVDEVRATKNLGGALSGLLSTVTGDGANVLGAATHGNLSDPASIVGDVLKKTDKLAHDTIESALDLAGSALSLTGLTAKFPVLNEINSSDLPSSLVDSAYLRLDSSQGILNNKTASTFTKNIKFLGQFQQAREGSDSVCTKEMACIRLTITTRSFRETASGKNQFAGAVPNSVSGVSGILKAAGVPQDSISTVGNILGENGNNISNISSEDLGKSFLTSILGDDKNKSEGKAELSSLLSGVTNRRLEEDNNNNDNDNIDSDSSSSSSSGSVGEGGAFIDNPDGDIWWDHWEELLGENGTAPAIHINDHKKVNPLKGISFLRNPPGKGKTKGIKIIKSLLTNTPPPTLDWAKRGKLTAAKNQGECASCWAFALTGIIEGQIMIRRNLTNRISIEDFDAESSPKNRIEFASLSVQQLLNCTQYGAHQDGGGCVGGNVQQAAKYFLENNNINGFSRGLTFWGNSPYINGELTEEQLKSTNGTGIVPGQCFGQLGGGEGEIRGDEEGKRRLEKAEQVQETGKQYPLACDTLRIQNGIVLLPRIENQEDPKGPAWSLANDTILMNLLQYGPVSVSVSAEYYTNNSDAIWSNYESGVMGEESCPTMPNGNTPTVDHAVLLIGYGTTSDGMDYWYLKNSYSSTWGDNGFFKLKRGNDVAPCGMYQAPIVSLYLAEDDDDAMELPPECEKDHNPSPTRAYGTAQNAISAYPVDGGNPSFLLLTAKQAELARNISSGGITCNLTTKECFKRTCDPKGCTKTPTNSTI